MRLTALTYKIALELCPGERFSLIDFHDNAGCNDVLLWAHTNFFYSYPEFVKSWNNGKSCEFHRVEIACHLCGEKPERNYAGVGNIFLLNNGISDDQIMIKTGRQKVRGKIFQKMEYVKNTPRLSPMICLCKDHIGSYFIYAITEKATTQLALL